MKNVINNAWGKFFVLNCPKTPLTSGISILSFDFNFLKFFQEK